jgi:anthranilate phosphoribosyltransferase
MNNPELTAIIDTLQARHDLSSAEMRGVITWFLTGQAEEEAMRQFLIALAQKGETTAELVGAAQALRDSMQVIPSSRHPIIDTCGTGGDGAKTFNISTAAALAIAASGVCVAKHGNRKITSSSGSADALSELGINLDASPATVARCLQELGICFCFAPHFHPAMRHVGAVRRQIPHPTIFNRLGPLANPARAGYQVLGVGGAGLQDAMAAALQQLGTERSLVVRGEDGVDEISLSAPTRVLEVTPQGISEHHWSPEDFGVARSSREGLFADDPASSAARIREVLSGQPGPCRDVVVLNAAAALWIAGVHHALPQCAQRVCEALDSGRAQQIVSQLADISHQTS